MKTNACVTVRPVNSTAHRVAAWYCSGISKGPGTSRTAPRVTTRHRTIIGKYVIAAVHSTMFNCVDCWRARYFDVYLTIESLSPKSSRFR